MDRVPGRGGPEQKLYYAMKGTVPIQGLISDSLSDIRVFEKDTSSPLDLPGRLPFFQWKAFISFLIVAFLLIFAWSSTSDLFEVPSDVIHSYKTYQDAKRHYFQNSVYWDSKREHFELLLRENLMASNEDHITLLLETVTPEILISFLVSKLRFSPERLNTISIMQKESAPNFTLIFSKPEQAIWPLRIIVSLETEISVAKDGVSLLFTRLRRGSEDMATGLAWAYFGSDLEVLKSLPVISMKANQSGIH